MTIHLPTSNDLSPLQIQTVVSRLPTFELSYETIAHKKVYPSYTIGIAIPNGKKYYAYFSFHENENVCYLMEIRENKHDTYSKKISKIMIADKNVSYDLCIGTLLYGTVVEENERSFFVIEDIIQYKGYLLGNIPFSKKIVYLYDMLENHLIIHAQTSLLFALPYMWDIESSDESSILTHYEKDKNNVYYTSHHIQLRKWNEISPHLNIPLNKIISKSENDSGNGNAGTAIIPKIPKIMSSIPMHPITMDYKKPQYRYSCVFSVCADIQFDVYHLYACGKNNSLVYYNIAGIPTLKTSIFMNGLFRKIKENKNIDYIEESDDEDDFEDTSEDKYVDLNKNLLIECVFHFKFKKWVPVKVAHAGSRIVHISKL